MGIEHSLALCEAGANIILTDIDSKKIKETEILLNQQSTSSKILSYAMDVTKKDQILEVQNDLKKKEIDIDILVNNAAVDPKFDHKLSLDEQSRLENFSLDQWHLEFEVGLTGAFLCSQIFGTCMASNGAGVILNIASDLSVIAPDQRLYKKEDTSKEMQPVKPITYSVIKTGLIGLTRYLATYWAEEGVRCNALTWWSLYRSV